MALALEKPSCPRYLAAAALRDSFNRIMAKAWREDLQAWTVALSHFKLNTSEARKGAVSRLDGIGCLVRGPNRKCM